MLAPEEKDSNSLLTNKRKASQREEVCPLGDSHSEVCGCQPPGLGPALWCFPASLQERIRRQMGGAFRLGT